MSLFFTLLNIALVLYIITSLSTIKHQLRLISKHLNIKEEGPEYVSSEEIESQLEDLNRN